MYKRQSFSTSLATSCSATWSSCSRRRSVASSRTESSRTHWSLFPSCSSSKARSTSDICRCVTSSGSRAVRGRRPLSGVKGAPPERPFQPNPSRARAASAQIGAGAPFAASRSSAISSAAIVVLRAGDAACETAGAGSAATSLLHAATMTQKASGAMARRPDRSRHGIRRTIGHRMMRIAPVG